MNSEDLDEKDRPLMVDLGPERQITLPKEVCDALGIRPGARLVLRLEGEALVVEPARLMLRRALEEISAGLKEASVTEEEWLESGRQIRRKLVREKWPHLFPEERPSKRASS